VSRVSVIWLVLGLEVATPIAPPPFRPRLPCSYLAKSRPQLGYWLPILWRRLRETVLLPGKCTVWRALTG